MRYAAYLCTSRHGVFYFRLPIPPRLHPCRRRTDIKVSLGTRSPARAKALSRLLAVAGQSELLRTSLMTMRYDEIREHVRQHFNELLARFRDGVGEGGPWDDDQLVGLRSGRMLAETNLDDWAELTRADETDGFLQQFCEARGIGDDLSDRDKSLMLSELQKGYREFIGRALDHNASFDCIVLAGADHGPAGTVEPTTTADRNTSPAITFERAVEQYFTEMERSGALAAKTETEKKDALDLLGQVTGEKSPSLLTKADAVTVKDALLRLPRNRSKNPATRNLTLSEMLDLKGVETISARTCNAYLSHMQRFMGWAVDNGHAAENPFQGMRIKLSKQARESQRKAFTRDEMKLIFRHLTKNPEGLVRKDEHKWPTLIAMFTGMRLNEVADIKRVDGVWCIDVTEDGGDNKRLKNSSSRRRVPVHERLIECGLLDFVERQREGGSPRLFPSLTYSKQNGYGRNVGRWFNESFLHALGLGGQGLVFHCLRHTIVTRLAQSDVQDTQVKAIVGHSQSGVTFNTYFKEGFLPAQLREAIHRFDV